MTSLMWFRRDLRLADNPALLSASRRGPVVPVFVIDPRLTATSGTPRLAFLLRCLASLDESLGGALVVRTGAPAETIAQLAEETQASSVVAAADYGPYGRERDAVVATRLAAAGVDLELVESPYAVPPGTITKADGGPYQVFTPFYRHWRECSRARPAPPPPDLVLDRTVASERIPPGPTVDAHLPAAGEPAGQARLAEFVAAGIDSYARDRDRPDRDCTSRLSAYLKFGCLHPRQVLDALASAPEGETLRRQLAWREFYADVVYQHPDSVLRALQPWARQMRADAGADADRRFEAWSDGRTGYPIVDAGMRQLLAEAWMHNRVRMIVASFLVKDLHLDWSRGALLFMRRLVDGDLASNAHGWQWVAGTGTDAAPYHRIFNPILQGRRFDPNGDYVRRWVPELADVDGPSVHEPWTLPHPVPQYPAPIVDHGAERHEALGRYVAARAGSRKGGRR